MLNPVVSVITPAFNAESTIADCVQSVAAQTTRREHILVDGASQDNTVAKARSFAPSPSAANGNPFIVQSEPDTGLYDAMNKGVRLASAPYIAILNADDLYTAATVLERCIAQLEKTHADICYGDLRYVDATDTTRTVRTWRAGEGSRRDFYWGWMPPHPTIVARRSLYDKWGGYRLDLGTAADYEWLVRVVVRQGASLCYVPETLVSMRAGGASNRSLKARLLANRMDRRAWRTNGVRPYPWTTMLKPLRKVHQFFSFV